MNDSFTFSEKELYKDGLVLLLTASAIEEILLQEQSIVILTSPTHLVGDQNVFCYDFSGRFKWQIPKPAQIHEDNFFSAVYHRNSELYAYSICGVEYHIDKESGEILNSELIK